MIMKSFYLKVGGCVVLVLLVVVGVLILWPGRRSQPVVGKCSEIEEFCRAVTPHVSAFSSPESAVPQPSPLSRCILAVSAVKWQASLFDMKGVCDA